MHLVQKLLLERTVKVAGAIEASAGGAATKEQLLSNAQVGGLTLTHSAKQLVEAEGFTLLPATTIRLTFLTPANLRFKKRPSPPEVRARALSLGLMLCPDDLAYTPQEWSRYPRNNKPYLYAIRHINRSLAPCFIAMTPINSEMLVVSTWHGHAPIDLDIQIGFMSSERNDD